VRGWNCRVSHGLSNRARKEEGLHSEKHSPSTQFPTNNARGNQALAPDEITIALLLLAPRLSADTLTML